MMMKDTMSFSPDPTLFYSWAGYNNTEILAGSWHHYYSLKIGDICQPGSFPKKSQRRDIKKVMILYKKCFSVYFYMSET